MKIPQINLCQNIQPLKKVEWVNNADFDTRKVFREMNFENDIFGTLNVGIRDYNDGFNRWIIELKNNLNKLLGKEILSMEKDTKAMTGYDIIVEPEYRRKGYGFGELMRLFSVMEMNENKAPELKIFSKGTAVYFHSKYKFVPCNTQFHDRDKMLQTMVRDSSKDFSGFSQRAKELRTITKETLADADKQRELCKETNSLAIEYINRAMEMGEPQIKHSFDHGMDMVLTRENIGKNKEFFNALFAKYGIDYKI